MRKVSARLRSADPARGNLIGPSMQMGEVELPVGWFPDDQAGGERLRVIRHHR